MPQAVNVTSEGIKPRFLYNSTLFDGATVTTNSEETDLPATNVQNEVVRRVWRTLGTTQMAWSVYDVGSTISFDMIGLFGLENLTAGVTIEANDADSWGTPLVSVGLTIPTDADGVVYERAISFAQGSARFFRLTLQGDNDGNPWGVGRLMIGEYFEPTLPMEMRVQRILNDPSLIVAGDGQQRYARQRDKYYTYVSNWNGLDNSDRERWEALFRNRGNTKPLVAAYDPTHTDRYNKDAIYGRITSNLSEALIQMEYNDQLQVAVEEHW